MQNPVLKSSLDASSSALAPNSVRPIVPVVTNKKFCDCASDGVVDVESTGDGEWSGATLDDSTMLRI